MIVLVREMERSRDVAACYETLNIDKSKVTIGNLEFVTPFMPKCGARTLVLICFEWSAILISLEKVTLKFFIHGYKQLHV